MAVMCAETYRVTVNVGEQSEPRSGAEVLSVIPSQQFEYGAAVDDAVQQDGQDRQAGTGSSRHCIQARSMRDVPTDRVRWHFHMERGIDRCRESIGTVNKIKVENGQLGKRDAIYITSIDVVTGKHGGHCAADVSSVFHDVSLTFPGCFSLFKC